MTRDSLTAAELDKFAFPVAVIRGGRIAYANDAFTSLLGVDAAEACLGLPATDLVAAADRERFLAQLATAGNAGDAPHAYAELALRLSVPAGPIHPVSMASDEVLFEGQEAVFCSFRALDDAETRAIEWPRITEAPGEGDSRAEQQQTGPRADQPPPEDSLPEPETKPAIEEITLHAVEPAQQVSPAPSERATNAAEAGSATGHAEELAHATSARPLGGEAAREQTRQPESLQRRRTPGRRVAWLAVFILACFIVGPGLLLPKVKINNVPKVYLPEKAPAVMIDDALRKTFPSDQGMVLLFEGAGLYSDDFLRSMAALTDDLRLHPRIRQVASVTSQDHIEGDAAGFVVEPLIDIDSLDELPEEARKQRILDDRFANRMLAAADGSALALVIIPVALDDSLARMALQDDIHALVEKHHLGSYVTAEAGQITTDVEQMRESISQNLRFVPMVVLIGLTMIWLLFRRWMAVVVSGVAIAAVVSATTSLFVLFDTPFNLISALLPPLLSALTIAALVHLFNALSYAAMRRRQGAERVIAALREIRKPALYNALTTIAGFASLGLSEIPPIRSLGLATAAGVAFIYLIVYQVVPPLFAGFDHKPWPRKRARHGLLDRSVAALFHLGIRRPLVSLAMLLVAIALCSPFLRNIVVETNLLEFFTEGHKTRVATERVEEKLSGTGSLDIVFTARQPEGLATPGNLEMIRRFQRWAEAQPEVDKSRSFADFVEEMHWGFHEQQDEYRTIPEDPSLIAQYLFIYDGTDLYDFVDELFQTTRVSLSINIHGASEISAFMSLLREYLQNNPGTDVDWEIAGISRMFADQVDLLVSGQIKSILGALAIIFVLMMIQWRSFRDSLICMIPNLSPVLLIFILMGAFNIWLDVATAMIASVAVGIAIDDTIHVYHGFIHRVRKGISPTVALARTYRQAGRAIMTTTIILCAQFLVLASSSFVPVQNFGLLTSIGLMAALVFDLWLLPAILVLIYRPGKAH